MASPVDGCKELFRGNPKRLQILVLPFPENRDEAVTRGLTHSLHVDGRTRAVSGPPVTSQTGHAGSKVKWASGHTGSFLERNKHTFGAARAPPSMAPWHEPSRNATLRQSKERGGIDGPMSPPHPLHPSYAALLFPPCHGQPTPCGDRTPQAASLRRNRSRETVCCRKGKAELSQQETLAGWDTRAMVPWLPGVSASLGRQPQALSPGAPAFSYLQPHPRPARATQRR